VKIIAVDNYDREMYDDILIAENVNKGYGEKIVKLMNNDEKSDNESCIKLVENSYTLYKFEI